MSVTYDVCIMAFPSSHYHDPLTILLEKEDRSCKGCVYKVSYWGVEVCEQHQRLAQRRCLDYSTLIPIKDITDATSQFD